MSSTVVALVSIAGHVALRLFAKVLSMTGSWVGYKRLVNDGQLAIPIVWPPDRATTSVASRFLVDRLRRISAALENGGGRFSRVSCSVANSVPSLLPNGTL